MIEYLHKTHPRSRSIKIKVEANGQVVVVTPKRYSQHQIDHFVQQNLDWIARVQAKLTAHKHSATTETEVMIFGKKYALKVEYSATQPVGVRVQSQTVTINPLSPTITSPRHASVKTQLERFLKNTAEKYVVPRTHQLAKMMKISFTTISLRQQKTRWGSCSSTGSLNFNWRLVHYSPPIIDYVIIHELAHRRQMNHSLAFWNIVKEYDPAFLEHRGWLKRHGMSLG
jgi:predicted metal-dependent hydrolase